jgi:hypothetical protein
MADDNDDNDQGGGGEGAAPEAPESAAPSAPESSAPSAPEGATDYAEGGGALPPPQSAPGDGGPSLSADQVREIMQGGAPGTFQGNETGYAGQTYPGNNPNSVVGPSPGSNAGFEAPRGPQGLERFLPENSRSAEVNQYNPLFNGPTQDHVYTNDTARLGAADPNLVPARPFEQQTGVYAYDHPKAQQAIANYQSQQQQYADSLQNYQPASRLVSPDAGRTMPARSDPVLSRPPVGSYSKPGGQQGGDYLPAPPQPSAEALRSSDLLMSGADKYLDDKGGLLGPAQQGGAPQDNNLLQPARPASVAPGANNLPVPPDPVMSRKADQLSAVLGLSRQNVAATEASPNLPRISADRMNAANIPYKTEVSPTLGPVQDLSLVRPKSALGALPPAEVQRAPATAQPAERFSMEPVNKGLSEGLDQAFTRSGVSSVARPDSIRNGSVPYAEQSQYGGRAQQQPQADAGSQGKSVAYQSGRPKFQNDVRYILGTQELVVPKDVANGDVKDAYAAAREGDTKTILQNMAMGHPWAVPGAGQRLQQMHAEDASAPLIKARNDLLGQAIYSKDPNIRQQAANTYQALFGRTYGRGGSNAGGQTKHSWEAIKGPMGETKGMVDKFAQSPQLMKISGLDDGGGAPAAESSGSSVKPKIYKDPRTSQLFTIENGQRVPYPQK